MARLTLSTKHKLLVIVNELIVLLRVIFVVCAAGYVDAFIRTQKRIKSPYSTLRVYRQLSYMYSLVYESDVICIDQLRMDRESFHKLCQILSTKGQLRGTRNVSIEEMVAMFLNTLAHHHKNRVIKFNFRRSGRTVSKYFVTDEEDDKLLESLLELHHDKKWKADTGFKNGYLKQLQHVMESKLPGCGILANPHIESRIKTLKTKYTALAEMLNQSGFSWKEQEMMLVCEKSVYIEWVEKRNKDAAGLYGKPFRHYYILGEIYGRDRANGMNVGNTDDDEEEIARENTNADDFNSDDDILFGNVNPIGDMGSQNGGVEDVDASFTQPSAPQQMHTQSASSNTSRRKGKALDEMSKNFGLMAKAVAGMAPKLDGLVNVLSTDKELTDLQSRLDGELSKMESLTPIQVFHVTNILAQKHDLLKVFFTMNDERKVSYVRNLLEFGLP